MRSITQKQFLRYLKYTPYLIWNNISDIYEDKKSEEVEDSFRWLRFDQEDLMIIDFDYKNDYSQKDMKAARIIQDKSDDFILSKFSDVYFIKSKIIDEAVLETRRVISSGKYDFIVNPIFKYNSAISRPRGYDVRNQCLYSQKFSASTKKNDWCYVFWNYIIAKESIKIKDLKLFVLSSGPNRKGEISFIITPTSNTQVSSPSFKYLKIEDGGFSRYCEEILNAKSLWNTGQSKIKNKDGRLSKYFEELLHAKFLWNIRRGKIKKIIKARAKSKIISTFNDIFILKRRNESKTHIGNKLMNMKIDRIIKDINLARNITEYKTNLINEMKNIQNSILPHENIKEILAYNNNELQGISGALLNKTTIAKYILNNNDSYKKDLVIKHIFEKKNHINKILVKSIIEPILNKSNRIVWYDFEGYSLPTATLDYFFPFQQTVFQVSIIETKNSKIQNKINKVYDPKFLSGDSFADIINSIYSLQAEVYVVYNKDYENTKLKEMVDWLIYINHPFAFQEQEKAKWIMDRTIDLANLFATRSRKKLPPIFLHELKGMYSIKLLEQYINHHKIDLPVKIYEYKKLEIQNGMMAMDTAIERSLGITGDKKWNEKIEALKIYCENDVNAMIMVYELAKYLIK